MTEAVLIAIITATPPTLVGLVSLIIGLRNSKQIKSVHTAINSGLDRQILNAGKAGELKGRKDTEENNKVTKD